jgi:hypothetical protein
MRKSWSPRAVVHIVGGGEVHLVHIVAREEIDPPRRSLLAADPEQPALQRFLTETTRREYGRVVSPIRAGERCA